MIRYSTRFRRNFALLMLSSGVLLQVIPYGCGRNILHAVAPILLDGTTNILDQVIGVVAPLVLP